MKSHTQEYNVYCSSTARLITTVWAASEPGAAYLAAKQVGCSIRAIHVIKTSQLGDGYPMHWNREELFGEPLLEEAQESKPALVIKS